MAKKKVQGKTPKTGAKSDKEVQASPNPGAGRGDGSSFAYAMELMKAQKDVSLDNQAGFLNTPNVVLDPKDFV
jgi:hypothetical protein